jgi:hypothetical protein
MIKRGGGIGFNSFSLKEKLFVFFGSILGVFIIVLISNYFPLRREMYNTRKSL